MKTKYRLLLVISYLLVCGIISYLTMKLMGIPYHDVSRSRSALMYVVAVVWIVYAVAIYVWKRNRILKEGCVDAKQNERDVQVKKCKQIVSLFMFLLTIACIWLPLLTINVIRTSDEIFKYWWVFFSFMPIPMLSIRLVKKDYVIGKTSKRNIVAGHFVMGYLILFGVVLFIICQYVLLNG